MKELVQLLQAVEAQQTGAFDGLSHAVTEAARKARDAMDTVNADAERARNDPDDSVGGLYLLAEVLERHGISRRAEDRLRPIAEEIIYLRQWPAVIAWCDETIDTLRARVRELEGVVGDQDETISQLVNTRPARRTVDLPKEHFRDEPSIRVTTYKGTIAGVDESIAPLVQALNDAGYQSVASCSGHGVRPASIILENDMEILIMPFGQARQIDRLWPDINNERIPRKARDAMDTVNADAESARNDPDDTVCRLLQLHGELDRYPEDEITVPFSVMRDAAEEIIYLRQWPAVIGWCDETIDTLRSRVAELERQP